MSALPPRQKVIPCLWFDRQAEEAVGFYVSLLKAYRERLLARPSFARCMAEARPYPSYFPLGAPDGD